MSFGSSAGRARSTGKGSKEKKAGKKKKQEYHTTRRRLAKEEQLDLESTKTRTVSALEHLGQQRFSAEPGSYNVQGWVKSLSLLLEDFESKIGTENLPAEYQTRKEAIMLTFSKPPDNSELELKLEALRREEKETKNRLDRESDRISARLIEVRNDNERQSKILETENAKLAELNEEREQVSFFSKLVGKRGPPTKTVEDRIAELKSHLSSLEAERTTLGNARDSMDRRPSTAEDPYGRDWKRLDEIGGQIASLEMVIQERMQRAEERAEAASELTRIIAAIPAAGPGAEKTDEWD